MNNLAYLIPYPLASAIHETPTLLVAALTFRKRLGHPQDAVAILASMLVKEQIHDFDWLGAVVEDGGEGAREGSWVYRLRVPRRLDGLATEAQALAAMRRTVRERAAILADVVAEDTEDRASLACVVRMVPALDTLGRGDVRGLLLVTEGLLRRLPHATAQVRA